MLTLFLLLILLAFVLRKNQKYFLVASGLLLVAIIVTRYGLGADYMSYGFRYNAFYNMQLPDLFSQQVHLEPGFKFLMYLFTHLGINYHIFLVVINVFCLALILKWIQDNSTNIILSILIYFSMFFMVWNLSALRQSIVISVSLYFLFNQKVSLNNYAKIALIMALATIHISALFLLVILWSQSYHPSKKQLWFILVGCFIVSMIPLNGFLHMFEGLPYLNKISYYIVDQYLGILSFKTMVRFIFGVVLILFMDSFVEKGVYIERLFTSAVLGFSFFLATQYLGVTSERLTIYTFFFVIVLFPIIYQKLESMFQNQSKYLVIPLFMVLSLFVIKETTTMKLQSAYQGSLWFEYPTIFDKHPEMFKTAESFLLDEYEQSQNNYQKWNEAYKKRDLTHTSVENITQFSAVKTPENKYGIIDIDGNIVTELNFNTRPRIIDRYIENIKIDSLQITDYYYIGGKVAHYRDVYPIIQEALIRELNTTSQRSSLIENQEPFKQLLEELPINKYEIEIEKVRQLSLPEVYYVINARINGVLRYYYVDSSYTLVSPLGSITDEHINSQGFLTILNGNIKYIYSSEKLLWMETR